VCSGGTKEGCDVSISGSGIWNNSGGDTLTLVDAAGEIVIFYVYTTVAIDQVFTMSATFHHEVSPVPGCTDSIALNYFPLATLDDGSCVYEEEDDSDSDSSDGSDTGEGSDDAPGGGDADGETAPAVRLVPLAGERVPRVPGHCPQGYTQWVDAKIEGTEWVVDDLYDTVVLVGGPPLTRQNLDGGRYLVSDGPLSIGMTQTRDWHDIGFVCVQ